MRAIYPGSFDVFTYGHLDLVRRGASLCDELIVGVADNLRKKPLFSRHERLEMLREATSDIANLRVETYDGLTVDFAFTHKARIIFRGLRFVSDFEFELQFAMANSQLAPDVETVFLAPSPQFSFISSSMVKQMAFYRRDVSVFVPPGVARALAFKYGEPLHPAANPREFNEGPPPPDDVNRVGQFE